MRPKMAGIAPSFAAAIGTCESISVHPLSAPSDETMAATAISPAAQSPHIARAASANGACDCMSISRGTTPITTAVPRM